MTLYIGLMSGTSMDGIDAALVRIPSNTLEHGVTKKYSDDVKRRIDDLLSQKNLNLASYCQLNTLIGREFAGAVNELLQEAKVSPSQVRAIGSHGQTVCHDTSGTIPYTLQMGCAHTISSLTKITVVADFRTRDIVNGGQGAPFAPLYHQQLFVNSDKPIAVVNVGGISNTTFLASNQPTQGWDVGPGNCLMDAWIFKHKEMPFDEDGLWAGQGEVIEQLLAQLLSDPFLALPSPKSIGKEYFSLSWLERFLKNEYKPVDVQATLVAFTAQAIARSILDNHQCATKRIYLCGGGTHNVQLHKNLRELLPGISVQSISDLGVSPDYLEAMMFAWFAAQTMNQVPLNLSSITGSKGDEILGAIYTARGHKLQF